MSRQPPFADGPLAPDNIYIHYTYYLLWDSKLHEVWRILGVGARLNKKYTYRVA